MNALKKIILGHLMSKGLVSQIGMRITVNGNAKKKLALLHLINLNGKMRIALTFAI